MIAFAMLVLTIKNDNKK
ncbi:hypothetical protein [Enterococcus faecium]